MLYKTEYTSPLGLMTLASDGNSLTGLWFVGQKYYGGKLNTKTPVRDELAIFGAAKEWLDRYFAGEKPDASELSLAPEGSEFRMAVWDMLCAVPYGQTVTYGRIAKAIAESRDIAGMSAQAVGGAVGHNPISIIIPCHRVVGANGSLTGYAGGIDRKKWLLEHEGK